jgi:hypothetical protein
MGVTLWNKKTKANNYNGNNNSNRIDYKMTKLINLMEKLISKLG